MMKATFKDRLIIQGTLMPLMPTKGSYIEMIQMDDLRQQTVITQKEVIEYNFRDGDQPGQIMFDVKPGGDIELNLTPLQIDFLQLAAMALDEIKMVDFDNLPTCKKIMELTDK
ncbi:hypothetical protein [Pedobacter nototheniae]|uniref:hypothetical protein n=1 Tax=Pedobacter nototheniae TaxID=2488994 RepID=UPI00103DC755|nr:hypothetical protein [Pedobacter nototheniae]